MSTYNLTLNADPTALTTSLSNVTNLSATVSLQGPQGVQGPAGPAGVADHLELTNIGTNTHAAIDTALTRLAGTSGTNTGDQNLSAYETTTQLNSRDTANRDRTNHTGAHAISTVTGLQTALDAKKTDSMATNKLLGRGTAATGVIEEITLGTNLSFTGTTLNASGGSGHTIKDEGVALTARTGLNFVGSTVTVTDDLTNNETDVTISAEAPITAGTTSQYYRGDKTFQTLDKTAVGLANVDNTTDVSKPVSTATQTALDAKVTGPASSTDNAIARFDGTTGKLLQNGVPTVSDRGDITFPSTNTGGENTSDSTTRLILNSHQRAESPNNYGEVIRIYSDKDNSKQMIAWYDRFTTPATPKLKAWIGWHYKPNDVSDPINPHDHFAIETPDTAGVIRTRLEVLGDNNDITSVNTTNANLTVVQGILGVTHTSGNSKQLVFYHAGTGRTKTARWSIAGNGTAESTGDVGSDLQVSRFNDAGTYVDAPFFIKRSTGNVGINTTDPSGGKLQVNMGVDGTAMLLRNTNAGGNNGANMLMETQTTTSRVFQAGLQTDTTKRLSVEASGKIEWGPGVSTARDTNLYRGAADTLKTDDSFVANNIATTLRTVTAATTITTTDSIIAADATTAAFTVTLPTAVGIAGRQYTIKRISSAANNVTVGTTSSQTIDGAATYTLSAQWQSVVVVSNGSAWLVV